MIEEKIEKDPTNEGLRAQKAALEAEIAAKTRPLSAKLARKQALDEAFKALKENLAKADPDSGLSHVVGLLVAEAIAKTIDRSYLLFLEVYSAGGNNKTSRNLFTGSKLSHSGGTIIGYILFDKDRLIASSGVVRDYFDYRNAKEICRIAEIKCVQ